MINTTTEKKPQPFEVALIRKLESKTTSIRDAFLLLDVDGDGRISPTDVRTALHNELGIDVTDEQEEYIFCHPSLNQHEIFGCSDGSGGMGYADFAKYYQDVSEAGAYFPTSQSGLAAAVGFLRDDVTKDGDGNITSSQMAIQPSPQKVLLQKRQQLRQLLTSHSSRESPGKSGMKETSLFLAMDTHRSGKVTMAEFLRWANEVGCLGWTYGDLRLVILGIEDEDEKGWFGGEDGSGEVGMTEHEFAMFVESLDCNDALAANEEGEGEEASIADSDSAVAGDSVAVTEAEEDAVSLSSGVENIPAAAAEAKGGTSVAATDASVAGSSVAVTEVEEDILVPLDNFTVNTSGGGKKVILTKDSSLDISICNNDTNNDDGEEGAQ